MEKKYSDDAFKVASIAAILMMKEASWRVAIGAAFGLLDEADQRLAYLRGEEKAKGQGQS